MKLKWKEWSFWGAVKKYATKRMGEAWMRGGNCDSCCPNCKYWESAGNVIHTTSNGDGSESRLCKNCGYSWNAIFTPAGFVPVSTQEPEDRVKV